MKFILWKPKVTHNKNDVQLIKPVNFRNIFVESCFHVIIFFLCGGKQT